MESMILQMWIYGEIYVCVTAQFTTQPVLKPASWLQSGPASSRPLKDNSLLRSQPACFETSKLLASNAVVPSQLIHQLFQQRNVVSHDCTDMWQTVYSVYPLLQS